MAGLLKIISVRNYSIRTLVLLALSLSLVACGERESGALPGGGFKVSFEKQNIPKEIKTGERVTAEIGFKNTSTVTWPSKPNSKNKNQVNLSYHWLNNKGEMVVFDGARTGMPNDLKAGESVELKPEILAPDKPGEYILEVTLVQEGVAWFPENDGDKIVVPVRVVAAQPGAQGAVAPKVASNRNDAEKKQEKKTRKERRREAREKANAVNK